MRTVTERIAEIKALRESFGMSQEDAKVAFKVSHLPRDPQRWTDRDFERAKDVLNDWGPGYRLVLNRKRGEENER